MKIMGFLFARTEKCLDRHHRPAVNGRATFADRCLSYGPTCYNRKNEYARWTGSESVIVRKEGLSS